MDAADERTTADNQSRFVVTLVHGTFAWKAAWTRPDSSLCTALRARFGERVLIESMKWSGWNTFGARHEGAAALREAMLNSRTADLPHIVIGHSHAGNIATYAAMSPETNRRLAGIVTLATPFIVARRRNLGQIGKLAAYTFAGLCYFVAFTLWPVDWSPSWPLGWAGFWTSLVDLVVLPIAASVIIQLSILRLLKGWFASCERMLEELQHGVIDRERFLIIRAVADEATGGITFMQFPSIAITLILGWLARVTEGCISWYMRLVQRRVFARLFLVCVALLWFVLGAALKLVTRSGATAELVSAALVAPLWVPVFALLLGAEPRVARIWAAIPLAILAVPAVFVLAATSLLALGPRFAFANLYLDVSVEATPVGRYDVLLMNPPDAGDPDRPGGWLHSALYDDEETIRLICDFIDARLSAPAPARVALASSAAVR